MKNLIEFLACIMSMMNLQPMRVFGQVRGGLGSRIMSEQLTLKGSPANTLRSLFLEEIGATVDNLALLDELIELINHGKPNDLLAWFKSRPYDTQKDLIDSGLAMALVALADPNFVSNAVKESWLVTGVDSKGRNLPENSIPLLVHGMYLMAVGGDERVIQAAETLVQMTNDLETAANRKTPGDDWQQLFDSLSKTDMALDHHGVDLKQLLVELDEQTGISEGRVPGPGGLLHFLGGYYYRLFSDKFRAPAERYEKVHGWAIKQLTKMPEESTDFGPREFMAEVVRMTVEGDLEGLVALDAQLQVTQAEQGNKAILTKFFAKALWDRGLNKQEVAVTEDAKPVGDHDGDRPLVAEQSPQKEHGDPKNDDLTGEVPSVVDPSNTK